MGKDFLFDIVEKKRAYNARRKALYDNIKAHLDASSYAQYGLFRKAISASGKINLIAEIKKASPSKGVIRQDFNVEALATAYQDAGAAAISVLTEEEYFLGKPAYLKQVSEKFNTPVLMKDFIIDEGQIYEGRYNGASAVLLIAAILTDTQIKDFLALGERLDVDCLVEVHDAQDLDRALKAGAGIIGVNNRDLRTFGIDLAAGERLMGQIPAGKVIVAESGVSTHEEIVHLHKAGANAVLIGETFLRCRDVGKKVRELMYGES